MTAEEKLLTTQELATRWGMHPGSLRLWRVKKKGPRYVRLGRRGKGRLPRVRYRLEDIEAFETKGDSNGKAT